MRPFQERLLRGVRSPGRDAQCRGGGCRSPNPTRESLLPGGGRLLANGWLVLSYFGRNGCWQWNVRFGRDFGVSMVCDLLVDPPRPWPTISNIPKESRSASRLTGPDLWSARLRPGADCSDGAGGCTRPFVNRAIGACIRAGTRTCRGREEHAAFVPNCNQ
jgi:hypothetical protein